ncbi:amino acid permease [Candidatus Margulisiibacteriota bacterium]
MKPKKMTVFTISIMISAAVVSLRGLPMMAKEGTSMIFYLLFAAVLFLIPASLVSAELGSAFSNKGGGVYTWVKEAFGSKWGFTAIWLQWIQNVVWYPTVLGFAAACLAYVVMDPKLAANGLFTGVVILVFYWIATLIALKGSHTASKVTKYGFLLGTLLPGIFIVLLGLLWVIKGNPLQFISAQHFGSTVTGMHARYFPNISNLGNIAFLAGIILLFAGVEVHAVHANDMQNPSKEFPISILLACIIIFFLFSLGSFAVAAVIPAREISLTAGLLQAFKQILTKFNIGFLTPVVGLFLAFGAIGQIMSWVDGPSKGLLETAKEGELPPFLAKVNKNGMQQNILIVQAVIVSILASLYFFMKNVSVAFFLLSAMTISLYLVMYILLYAAGIKLRFSQPKLKRPYKVPGGILGMSLVSGIGLLGVGFALLVSFFPPTNLPVGNPPLYVGLVVAGLIIFVGLPLWISSHKKPEWKKGKKR